MEWKTEKMKKKKSLVHSDAKAVSTLMTIPLSLNLYSKKRLICFLIILETVLGVLCCMV